MNRWCRPYSGCLLRRGRNLNSLIGHILDTTVQKKLQGVKALLFEALTPSHCHLIFLLGFRVCVCFSLVHPIAYELGSFMVGFTSNLMRQRGWNIYFLVWASPPPVMSSCTVEQEIWICTCFELVYKREKGSKFWLSLGFFFMGPSFIFLFTTHLSLAPPIKLLKDFGLHHWAHAFFFSFHGCKPCLLSAPFPFFILFMLFSLFIYFTIFILIFF